MGWPRCRHCPSWRIYTLLEHILPAETVFARYQVTEAGLEMSFD